MDGKWFGINAFRVSQLILAIVGLVLALTTNYTYVLLIVFYVIAVIYLTVLTICVLASKTGLSGTAEAIIEVVIGLSILIYSIYVISSCGSNKDVILVCAVVNGFLLPALFFITAYEKS